MPRMTGKRAMLEQLIADGVRHVFGNPGTTEQGFTRSRSRTSC
jgi:benzoylformate decarboxylase